MTIVAAQTAVEAVATAWRALAKEATESNQAWQDLRDPTRPWQQSLLRHRDQHHHLGKAAQRLVKALRDIVREAHTAQARPLLGEHPELGGRITLDSAEPDGQEWVLVRPVADYLDLPDRIVTIGHAYAESAQDRRTYLVDAGLIPG
ncbi:hypothetical protein GCM10022243_48650 [Saccharothrix violaceirubra]|uniref:Uncharacterized protein n=1 Tax=Saccharothrix violaceirubra TaxID=413306 RepID=A0A7W7SZF5_9PSEU|nr:hypothetical protein [Saccharothrix violaceirubra]MBB4963793.1 hypothetical protein [Saccharothrix violaceirubra]